MVFGFSCLGEEEEISCFGGIFTDFMGGDLFKVGEDKAALVVYFTELILLCMVIESKSKLIIRLWIHYIHDT